MKKIISLLVVIALIAAGLVISAFAADEPTILVEKTEAKAGEEVIVAVVIENNPGFAALELTVDYNEEALTLKNVTKGEVLTDGMFDYYDGAVAFVHGENITGNGTLLTMTFTVNANAAATENTTYPVSVVIDMLANQESKELTCTVDAGSITVTHVCDLENLEDVGEVPAECEKEGTEAHQKCSCGKLYQEGKEVTEADLVIEKLNHKNAENAEYEYEYLNEEETLWNLVLICPDCDKVLECHVPGTQLNPLYIIDQNYDTMDVEYAFTTLAGEDTYLTGYGLGGMIMTLKAEGITVTVDGVALEPVDGVYTCTMTDFGMRGSNNIVIKSETAQELELVFSFAVGSMQNPAELELSWNTAELPADSRGYFYTWTAEADGLLVVIMQGNNWTYVINNYGENAFYGDTHYSDDETVVRAQVVKVSAGDVIEMVVGTADYTAAAVEFTAAFATGTAEDPVLLDFFWNDEQTEATLNVDMPAGEYVCGQYRIGNLVLTLDGTETAITNNGFMYPSTFTIAGEEAAVHSLVLSYPVGAMENPDELEEGDNATEIPAGTQGYYYEWTATEDGTVTITVSAEGGYFFVVNNLTTGIYGESMWSDSDPLVNPVVLEVKAGETIQVIVNTYDPEAWEAPAGTVNVNFDFVSAPAKTGDPITVALAVALISGMGVVALTKKKEN